MVTKLTARKFFVKSLDVKIILRDLEFQNQAPKKGVRDEDDRPDGKIQRGLVFLPSLPGASRLSPIRSSSSLHWLRRWVLLLSL